MLAERLDQTIRLCQSPCLFDVLPCLIHASEAHQVHDDHKMRINRGHRVYLRMHGQCQLRYGQGAVVVFLQIHLMCQHIARPQLHTVRQTGNVTLQIHINGHGQVKQHRGRRDRKRADGTHRRRGFPLEIVLQIRLHLFEGAHGLLDIPPAEAGKEPHKVG